MKSFRETRITTRAFVVCAFASISLIFVGCKEDEPDPVAPELTFISVSPLSVVAHETPLTVIVHYLDHQGDLGFDDPDEYAIKVRDARLADNDWYHLPPMTPAGIELSVEGDLDITVPPLFLLGNGTLETTRLTVQIVDRAGNWSNPVESPEITISAE